jgi:salicylate hydroxylase
MRVAIVGAGVAGCILARSLSKLPGLEVTCLEKVQADDQSESGTGLNMGPNAALALRTHDPELAARADAACERWRSWRISLTDGSEIGRLAIDSVASELGWRFRWSELYRVLREAAGPVVRYGATITEIGQGADGRSFIAWTESGEAHRLDGIDLLIGADGRYSQVREHFSGKPAMRQFGISIFRMLVSDTSGGLIDDYEQWFNGNNRLLAFRVKSGQIYITGTFPIPVGSPTPEELKRPEALRAAYTPKGGQLGAQAAWMVDVACANVGDLHWARLQESELSYGEPEAGVLYLGDSAHGMVPTLGQGATQAVEDACVIASLVAERWNSGSRDAAEWIRAASALRSERMRFVMDLSVEASDTMIAGTDPVAGSRRKFEPAFLAELRRLYCDIPGLTSAPARPLPQFEQA